MATFGEYDYICVKPRAEAQAELLSKERDAWAAQHMNRPQPGTMSPSDCIRREYIDLLQKDQQNRSEQFPLNSSQTKVAAEEDEVTNRELLTNPERPTIEKRQVRQEAKSDPNPMPETPVDPAMQKDFRQLSDTLSFLRTTRDPPGSNPEHTVEGSTNTAMNHLRPRSSAIPRPEGPKQQTPEQVAATWREEARKKYPLAGAAEVSTSAAL